MFCSQRDISYCCWRPGEGKGWDNHANVYEHLMEEVKEAELDFSQSRPVTGEEQMGTNAGNSISL